jgi:HK97 family phage prohead protease
VVFALNHNYDFTMARTSVEDGPGMLVLEESPKGLETYAELAPTSAARDLKVLIESRVIGQMSFSWPRGALKDDWNDDFTERSISEFTDLIDVSPVVHPAYAGTQASMRDLVSALTDKIRRVAPAEEERLTALLELALSNRSEELVVRADGPEPDDVAEEAVAGTGKADEPVGQPYRLAARKRRLQLMALTTRS